MRFDLVTVVVKWVSETDRWDVDPFPILGSGEA